MGVRSAMGVRGRLFMGTIKDVISADVAGRFSLARACISLICRASSTGRGGREVCTGAGGGVLGDGNSI